MENDTNEQQPAPAPIIPPPQAKTRHRKAWIIWLLIVLILASLALSGYLWWLLKSSDDSNQTLQKDKQQLQSQIDKLRKESAKKDIAEEDVACKDTPTTAFKDNIKAALDTKNTAVFATYTSNPVRFVLAASEKGGNETPAQAAVSLEYTHSATGPWDFNLPAATLADYDAGFYTDYFDANTYVGRAGSGMVAAFDFDCDGKISQIFIAADEDLL